MINFAANKGEMFSYLLQKNYLRSLIKITYLSGPILGECELIFQAGNLVSSVWGI
jgi:hypothetical protein